jgi:hypothetical protein
MVITIAAMLMDTVTEVLITTITADIIIRIPGITTTVATATMVPGTQVVVWRHATRRLILV